MKNQQPTTNNLLLTTNEEPTTMKNRQPTTDNRQPKNGRSTRRFGRWLLVVVPFLLPALVFAQTDSCPEGKLCNPIKFPNFIAFALAIVNTVVQYGALLIVFFLVFAGFKFVVAQGNSEKISEARKMLTWIVVGAFVLLGVYVIRAAICGTVGQLGIDAHCEANPFPDSRR